MRTRALLVAAALAAGLFGTLTAQAKTTVCYEYHVNVANTVVQESGPKGQPACTTLPPG